MRPVLLVLVALLPLAGCAGSEADTPSSSNATLFLAGDGVLTVVDVEAGRVRDHPLTVLAPGDPPHRLVRREDELVLWGYDTYVLDADLSAPPRKLGDSWFFVPSAQPDRVWLAHLDRESPETVRALDAVSEVSVDGRVTVPRVPPPDGRWPVAAVGDVLVFESRRGGLELWRPAARAFTARLTGAALGPSQGDLLAWCEAEGRLLHVTDVRAESGRTVAPPEGFAAFDCASGAFSPDGRWLAVPVVRSLEHGVSRSLALVNVEERIATAVQGSTVNPDYVFVAWSQGGDRVFLSGGPADDRQLLQYRLGEPRASASTSTYATSTAWPPDSPRLLGVRDAGPDVAQRCPYLPAPPPEALPRPSRSPPPIHPPADAGTLGAARLDPGSRRSRSGEFHPS